MRNDHHRRALRSGVLDAPGDLDSATRQRLIEYVEDSIDGAVSGTDDFEPALKQYLDTIGHRAAETTAADVEGVRQAGYTDAALFEITVAAAVGAGLSRVDRALQLLRGEGRAT